MTAAARRWFSSPKYRNRKTVIDGITFDSRREATVYCALRQRADLLGKIVQLERQVRFPLLVHGQRVCTFVADFTFVDKATGEFHVVDVKGFPTPTYRLKAKLFRACYGFAIEEWK